jgi:enoyl-CoA hydratase
MCAIQSHMFSPETALEAGFFDELVSAEEVLPRAIEHATQLATLPAVYGVNKMMLRQTHADTIKASLN